MTIPNSRSVSPGELEVRRTQAIVLFRKGMTRGEIAEVVGAHRNTVGEWIRVWKEDGLNGLKVQAPGRPKGTGRKLTPAQETEVRRSLVDKTADQLKFDFALWTREAVRELIRDRFSIEMPLRTITDYLRRWGFTPQKPVRRSYERCDAAVRRWLDEEYSRIARQARREKAEIHWGDETGLRSDDARGRGFSPRGTKPVRRCKGTPEKINMISTVTNLRKVRFMFYRETMRATVLIRFLKRLVKSVDKKVYLILDNLRTHHSQPVREWVEKNKNKIALFYLPSYSPDLNPDEYLNNDLKSAVGKAPQSRKKGKLETTAKSKMKSIQKQPQKVINYFKAQPVQYAR